MNYGPASKYYDLFGSKDDIGFFRDLAMKHGRKALELGVGTGRVAIELAKVKVALLGIDNSRYMLDVARQKLRKESVSVRRRVRLRLGDMRDFRLHEAFPFVYIASSTFEHCLTVEDQRRCLKSVHTALESKGTLAFDISQPAAGKPLSSWWIDRREVDRRNEVVRTIFSRRNPQTNVVSVNLFFDVCHDGKVKERYFDYGEVLISAKKDIANMLQDIGFRLDRVYGDFDMSAYTVKSPRAVFVCHKP